MRYDEYINEIGEIRTEFLRQDDETLNQYALDNRVMAFQAIAFGLYRHLMWGKIKKADPLYKYLQPYLLEVHRGYLKRI